MIKLKKMDALLTLKDNQNLMTNIKLDTGNTNLLIIPCSKIKKPISNSLALNLYDGPFFRMIRKYKPNNFDILILSAKYGLIKEDMVISHYDQKMTQERAIELRSIIHSNLVHFLSDKQYKSVYINLGKLYFEALEPSMKLFDNMDVHQANGGIGLRLHQLKKWIYNQ